MVFNEYPYRNIQDLNLDYLESRVRNLEKIVAQFVALESVTFADPIQWSIATQYAKNTIVLDKDGNAFLAKQAVPTGVYLYNEDYWLEIFNFMDYVKSFDSNLTFHIEANTDRATAEYSEDDWLLWDDILYKVTAAIAVDELLIIDTNIERFTVEDFCRAWQTYMVNTIDQYKRDIDASELEYKNDIDLSESQYRTQLANDIIATTASLQAQLDAAIAGVTVDSEVINARVGINDIAYATLGEAIRNQIGGIVSSLGDYTINKFPFDDTTKSVNSVSIHYQNGYLTANGTATGDGGRTNKIARFYLDAGTYTVKEDLRAIDWFIEKASDDSIIAAMNGLDHVKTFTLTAKTELYIGVNTVNTSVYNSTAKIIVYAGTGDESFIEPLIVNAPYIEAEITDLDNLINNRALLRQLTNNGISDFNDAAINRVYLILDTTIANIPAAVAGTLITFAKDSSAKVQFYYANNDIFYYRTFWGSTWSDWHRLATYSELPEKSLPFNILPTFANITCAGDSLTWSQVYTDAVNSRQAYAPYPKVLEKITGVPTSILAVGGYSAIDWWTAYENSIVSKTDQLAIIFLGTNGGFTETLDTDAPIADDPATWANTNTGCLAKIINKFKTVGAKVCLVKCFVTSGYGTSNLEHTNATIEAAATRFECGLAENPQITAAAYHYYPDLSGTNNVHYNDLGYAAFANQLITRIANMDGVYLKFMNPN